MTVGGRSLVDGPAQHELVDDGLGPHIEHLTDGVCQLCVRRVAGAEGVHHDGDRVGDADGVGKLHLAFVRQAGGHDVLGDVPGHVRRRAVHLSRVLAGEGAPAVPGIAAVGVHDDFPAGEPGVGRRAAFDEAAGGVDQDAYTFEAHVSEGRVQHMVHEGRHQIHLLHTGEMLSRDDDGFKAPGLPIGPVAHRNLRFAVREDKGDGPGFAGLCELVGQLIRKGDGQDAGGIYYGVNAVSHNLIICNRGNLLNGNGFITGVSGSGKSMAAKQEVSALALSTDHDIIIVDPEREYGELVRALGGEVITISAADPNGCHINALDLSEGYGDGKEPLVMKSEFIMSLYEQLMGSDKIEPQEKSIIDRSVGNIYREYLKNYQGQPPTLKDLYDDLMKQVNPEAHRIALALELFTVGSLNVFSHQTNINTKSRILCFDIQDLGENLKSVGLLVMLDAIYNRVIQNRKQGKYTHVYIDEIYLFFANGSGSGHSITNYSGEFLYKCWKRFRKYGATLTGITQNVEECLLSNTARMMFANSEFLLMLNQATTDREQLARLLGASDTQMSYVDNAPAGHGLIKVGGAIVPFANELPKNTELYRLMSTRPGED